MNDDYSKRGYLLPKGCKDLIDVLKSEAPAGPDFKTRASEGGFLITGHLAGLRSGDLEVIVEGRSLRISGKHSGTLQPFERVIDVPIGYDIAQANAGYLNGELRI